MYGYWLGVIVSALFMVFGSYAWGFWILAVTFLWLLIGFATDVIFLLRGRL